MSNFSQAPNKVDGLVPFTFSIPKEEIDALNTLLKRPLPIATWENSQQDGRFGVSRDWVANAISQHKYQESINAIPNFKVPVEDDGETYDVHFAGLFSQKKDATPLLLSHGWPGSFLEFLPILSKVQKQYASDPASLPYHLIVPSVPGYGFTKISTRKNMTMFDASRILNKLMVKLGFKQYIAQGGDIGSMITKTVVEEYDECIAGHVNMLMLNPPQGEGIAPPTEIEQRALDRGAKFLESGMAYAMLHGTRPATASFAVGASPVSLIGEKMIEWSDETPSIETILGNVSLYWFTGCYPSSIYPYRELAGPTAKDRAVSGSMDKVKKPFGSSWFPLELASVPKSWAEATGKVSFFKAHDKVILLNSPFSPEND
ncbi:hypothetical protein INS49_009956 [Diaporthe citri]|uniref:uncharacterized protein n=1 Tax=Diaporthe citri TaxID=83186 RepID=UPI001C7FD859|nr:uncharacterized protein INS49_009956 [Diaporthe citri]KAG6361728.1 hypothetical protein INS49_009956 [Diaporthe citri]